MSEISSIQQAELICPECGYDLRGIDSLRCPECGTPFDQASASLGALPWARRKTIGRIRAYLQSVWVATARMRTLASEINRPVRLRCAQRFRMITTSLASIIPIGIYLFILREPGGANAILGKRFTQEDPLAQLPAMDALFPWYAGVVFWPIPVVAMVLFLYLSSGVVSYWFHPRRLPVLQQNRAVALSHYLCASLFWMAIPLFGSSGMLWLAEANLLALHWRYWFDETWALLGGVLLFAVWFMFWLNTLRLMRMTTQAGARRLIVAAIGLPLSWGLCALVALGVFPWVAGFIFIIIDSLL